MRVCSNDMLVRNITPTGRFLQTHRDGTTVWRKIYIYVIKRGSAFSLQDRCVYSQLQSEDIYYLRTYNTTGKMRGVQKIANDRLITTLRRSQPFNRALARCGFLQRFISMY